MAVSKRLRYEILRRDSHTCRYCGLSAPEVKLTVDHVVPTALGGSDDPSNLVAACRDCNAGKSASSPDAALVAAVDEKAVQWSQAMQVVLEQRIAELEVDRKRVRRFERHWAAYQSQGAVARLIPRPANWKNSVLRFMAAGLDDEFLRDAVDTAMGNTKLPAGDVWRYFCGICWRELDSLREKAAALLAAEPSAPPAAVHRNEAFDFDYMVMFDEFLDGVIDALGHPPELRKFVDASLYLAMPEAHAEFRRTRVLGIEEANEAAREHMSSYIARDMYEIKQWREARGAEDGS